MRVRAICVSTVCSSAASISPLHSTALKLYVTSVDIFLHQLWYHENQNVLFCPKSVLTPISPATPTSPDPHLSGTRHPHVLALVTLRVPLGPPNCQKKHPQSRNPTHGFTAVVVLWVLKFHPNWKLLRVVRIQRDVGLILYYGLTSLAWYLG